MRTNKFHLILKSLLLLLVLVTNIKCERDLSEDATLSTFSKTAEVYLDAPVAMGSNFYLPYADSKFTAFSIDNQQGYKSKSSIRIDVPSNTDPLGTYAGAIFRVDGPGRNLSEYDALTFWAKASQGVTISEFGFGEDFITNNYITTIKEVSLDTNWKKIIIPIANASKLIQERGMFRYAAGTQGTSGLAYTFWVDEIKFEKLGTIAHGRASILNGANTQITTFTGTTTTIDNVKIIFNMPDGRNLGVFIKASFLEFTSSNPSVATVNAAGVVTPLSVGTAVITAKYGGVAATGSLTVNCQGAFVHAPTPTRNAANVLSVFSNAYTNLPVTYYNGYWAPWQTTLSNDFTVQGDNVLSYTNFNFVGIEFSTPTINASSMTHIHLDVFIPGPIVTGRKLKIELLDFGANGVFGGGDDKSHSTYITAPRLVSQSWISIDIPFSSMTNLTSRARLAQLIFGDGDGSVLNVDNIYFYN